jgi:hypothetical protein
LECRVGDGDDFKLNAFFYLEPVKRVECWCDVVKFPFAGYCAGHVILDYLEFVDVAGWQVEVEGVTVVKLGLDKACCYDAGGAEIEGGADASEITQVVGTRMRQSRDLLVEGEFIVKEETKVSSIGSR